MADTSPLPPELLLAAIGAQSAPASAAEYEAEHPPPAETPPPLYVTYEEYRAAISLRDVRAWCGLKAKRANRGRLLSGRPVERISTEDVYSILVAARGRCSHCGSLAVEGAPVHPVTRKPAPWGHVGRRIGSLDHIVPRIEGGPNAMSNLRWSCHWCNTWPGERTPGAEDHGGIQP
ncbi:HNH endonuclease [Streptomyces sp. NBC_00669]|uniref:HNH endonuclease n=1 Tax=Streptomyces sp. NBC_00669 TaxID=2976011 RepID=UPI002E2F5469|nr:HNH endonuclease [Streptomyces sp. NBC_00669]